MTAPPTLTSKRTTTPEPPPFRTATPPLIIAMVLTLVFTALALVSPRPANAAVFSGSSVTCSSWNSGYAECNTSATITAISVANQHSSSACTRNHSYGSTGSRVWVNHGCRATFTVSHTSGGSPGSSNFGIGGSTWTNCAELPRAASNRRLDDPLHGHFSRVANMTVDPLGHLTPVGGAPADFDNFTDNPWTTHRYRDGGGVEWVLQPPGKSEFHQPDVSGWTGWPFKKPTTRAQYPNRKFVSQTFNGDQSAEIIMVPDNPWTQPHTYHQQKIIWNGELAGTFNYGTGNSANHLAQDVRPHNRGWWSQETGSRPGSAYYSVSYHDRIRQRSGEGTAQFIGRLGATSQQWVQLQNLTHAHQVARFDVQQSTYGTYRIVSANGVIHDIRPELTHAFTDYLQMYNRSCP